jgi:hypothetical protein
MPGKETRAEGNNSKGIPTTVTVILLAIRAPQSWAVKHMLHPLKCVSVVYPGKIVT